MTVTLKHSITVRKRLSLNPCTNVSHKDAARLVVAVEAIFGLAYILHGVNLCVTDSTNAPYASVYIALGATYSALTVFLWRITTKTTARNLHVWILISKAATIVILLVTVSRVAITLKYGGITKELESSIVWNICGLFLQPYFIWVVWAFKKDFERNAREIQPASSQKLHNNPESKNAVPESDKEGTMPTTGSLVAEEQQADSVPETVTVTSV